MKWSLLLTAACLLCAMLPVADALSEDISSRGDVSQASIRSGQLQLMTRGPIHEAFASPHFANSLLPPKAPSAAPEPLDEHIPAFKPIANVEIAWIGGYWLWNDENDAWDWVSGTWRAVPAGRRWIPGYWTTADGGRSRRVAGFWAHKDMVNIPYTSAPPKPEEEQPAKLTADQFWIPGHWLEKDGEFHWQPGRVEQHNKNQVWVAGQYHWTPGGYVFSAGHWDYPFLSRGWLFAPVALTNASSDTDKISFTPTTLLDLKTVSFELFANASVGMYYFGDYYGDTRRKQGFYPIYSYGAHQYEPIFAYQNWFYGRQNPNWLRQTMERLRGQAINPNRPGGAPMLSSNVEGGSDARQIVLPLNEFIAQAGVAARVERLDATRHERWETIANRERQTADQRRIAEGSSSDNTESGVATNDQHSSYNPRNSRSQSTSLNRAGRSRQEMERSLSNRARSRSSLNGSNTDGQQASSNLSGSNRRDSGNMRDSSQLGSQAGDNESQQAEQGRQGLGRSLSVNPRSLSANSLNNGSRGQLSAGTGGSGGPGGLAAGNTLLDVTQLSSDEDSAGTALSANESPSSLTIGPRGGLRGRGALSLGAPTAGLGIGALAGNRYGGNSEYNGVPGAQGNTLGGYSALSGGGPLGIAPGIGSGYQGGMPAGGINTPSGAYGLGTPAGPGASNYYGPGNGGLGNGTPGAGS